MADRSARFVEAIQQQRLAAFADELLADDDADDETRSTAERARLACRRIAERVAGEHEQIVELLSAAGIEVTPAAAMPETLQYHAVEVRVADAETAERAAKVLAAQGFEAWERWAEQSPGAERSFRRYSTARIVVRATDVTIVATLRWADPSGRSTMQRLVSPTAADWHAVDLPDRLWWGYSLVRPLRLLAERAGLRGRHHSGLGPFLATPDELIPALLDAASVTADDVVVDLGCGDGRLVVAAAERGARARGIEHDADLAARARSRGDEAAVADRLEVVTGDARDVDVSDATVAMIFLPVDVAAELLPSLLDRLSTGARLLVHEQRPLPGGLSQPPGRSLPIIGDAAITVAHIWDVAAR